MPEKMRRRRFLHLSAAALAAPAVVLSPRSARQEFDILIRNGLVYDGLSNNPTAADIGIAQGRIARIGTLAGARARLVIDARERVVCPGFIDIHSHSEDDLLADGRAESKIRQGVTTEILGQDGGSYAPLNDSMFEQMRTSLLDRYNVLPDWRDFAGFYARLRTQGIAVNVLSMVGTGTLREYVVGYADRPASKKELADMQNLLRQSLHQGARHLSSGLEYTPGSFAGADELAELAAVLGKHGLYSTHMRNEDDHLLEAVREAIGIARAAGVRLNISHLKIQGQRNWDKGQELFDLLGEARAQGMQLTCDRYPYVAYNTSLRNLFPLWSREGEAGRFIERLQDPGMLPKIREAVQAKIASLGSWDAVMISHFSANPAFAGKRLGALAAEHGKAPSDFLIEMMLLSKGSGGMVGFGMSEENTAAILAWPWCAVASDGSALATEGPLATGSPHPRNFGTFPRVLSYYVRERKTFDLATAIRKMTSLPAEIIGLAHRGRLQQGLPADIVVFDPEQVRDRATFADPKKYPQGIEQVIVNGVPVIRDGEHTGERPGRILA